MARGKNLLDLLDDLRAESRLSLNPAHNAQVRESQIKQLRRAQEWLWDDFDWPHLRVTRQIPLQAGQRYYDPPGDVSIDRIIKIEVRYNGRWMDLCPSIDSGNYATYDSDLDERAWPAMRWALYEDEQIEVWPVPDDNADSTTLEGTLRVTGIRNLNPLVDDTDTCDIESRLIVAFAAAEVLAAAKSPDAPLKLKTANGLYDRIRGKLIKVGRFRVMGKQDKRSPLRGPPPVYYRVVSGE